MLHSTVDLVAIIAQLIIFPKLVIKQLIQHHSTMELLIAKQIIFSPK